VNEWEYYVLFDTPRWTVDEPYGLARLPRGASLFHAEALTPEGTWRRSSTLDRAWSRGEPEVAPVSRERAVELVTRWYATGVRGDIPDDLRDGPGDRAP
jgi:hypothetical protein